MDEDKTTPDYEGTIDVDRASASQKLMVTTTVPQAIKDYLDRKNIPVNRLIEIGFRQLILGHRTNQRINELEIKTTQLEKAIEKYDKRIRDMWEKFNIIKTKYKFEEDI